MLHDLGSGEELDERLAAIGLSYELVGHSSRHDLAPTAIIEEIHRHGGPNESHDALGYHGTVEDGATVALTLHAAGHERTLCGVEAADGSTGDGEEEAWEQRVLRHVTLCA